MGNLDSLETTIGYRFADRRLLAEALTHSSYSNEHTGKKVPCNERLEFLGDAVLSIISADFLYRKYPEMNEGALTKRRSSLVCTKTLSSFARSIDLGSYIKFGNGEKNTGAQRDAVLENAFEALIAAVYLDGGMEEARAFVLPFLEAETETHRVNFRDYKSLFQEIIQKNPDETFHYALTDATGPDHDKRYFVELRVNSNVIGRGSASSKKQAEQLAAKEALQLMGIE